jgi:hypothetical protein
VGDRSLDEKRDNLNHALCADRLDRRVRVVELMVCKVPDDVDQQLLA